MNQALFIRRDALRRGGFTLIEVVIALAIFVFGALAIIRIFPPALGVIQNSGDKLTAQNLNNTTLADFAKGSSSVPDAIHSVYYPSTNVYFPNAAEDLPIASSVVGTAIRNNSLPKRNVQLVSSDSALGHFTYITGEKQKVRQFTYLRSGLTPTTVKCVLTSFPVAGIEKPGIPPAQKLYPVAQIYKETPVKGVVAKTIIDTNGKQQSGYLDFTDSSPSFTSGSLPDTLTNFYYVTYQYIENGILNTTEDEVIRSQTPNTPSKITIDQAQLLQGRRLGSITTPPNAGDPPGNYRVVDGPVQIRFRNQLADLSLNTNADVTDDESIQNTLNTLGVLVVENVGVSVGDEVSVDYKVNGWQQIMHGELPSITPETLPVAGPPTVPATPDDANRTSRELVLPIRGLDDSDDGTIPGSLSSKVYGLFAFVNPNSANTPPMLQVNALDVSNTPVNLTRNGPPNPSDKVADLATNNPFFLWNVNRKGGRVLFDISDHALPPLTKTDYQVVGTRVVYRTLDNWTHQVSVAPTTYTPFYSYALNNRNIDAAFTGNNTPATTNVNVAQPWRYYAWTASSAQPGRIFFPPSEAGKTISLSYTYTVGGVTKEVDNGVVTINASWIRDTDAPVGAARDLAVADANGDRWLAYAEPQPTGIAPSPLTSIRSIKGLSIQARTAWLDGSNFSQVSTVGFRGGSS